MARPLESGERRRWCAREGPLSWHATILTKLALVDPLDHTLQELLSPFATMVVDDTQVQAVGMSHQVSQQLQRAIDPVHEARAGGRGLCGIFPEAGDHHQ